MFQMDHEICLIKSFVIKERQQRYINLIATKRGRIKFRSYIAHFNDLDNQFCFPLIKNLVNPNGLYELLNLNGAPETCYVISEHDKYDQNELHLKDAINELFLSGLAYFISCIPGKLAYYEGEDLNSRYTLQKKAHF